MILLYSVIGFVFFLCVFWGVWGTHYFLSTYNMTGVGGILPSDMSYILFAVALPIILLLMLVLIFCVIVSNNQNKNILFNLLQSNKSSMSGIQTIAKSLIEVRKLGFTNQFFTNLPIIFNNMSQIIADIISQTSMASDVVVYDALSKDGDNKLYSVCKIILDKRESTPHFDESLRRLVKKDDSLAGMISIFSEKYDNLLKFINKYDLDGFVSQIIEEGDLGKVRNILLASLTNKDDATNLQEGKYSDSENISLLNSDLNIFPSEK